MFLSGTWITLYVAIIGTIIGFLLGFLIGVIEDVQINREDNIFKKIIIKLVKIIFAVYVEVFRDTPMIVQAMVIYYGIRLAGGSISPIPAGILVTFLNTGAYMAETVRAGIKSIDVGQREGALALGMSPLKAMVVVIIPQAFRNIIPEMANMFLTNLKMTSVLNVIGVSELFLVAKTTGAIYYRYFEAYLLIAVIFFVLCFIFNRLFLILEKKLAAKKDYVLAVGYIDDGQ
ncbi:ABC transporter, permease protein [[Bacteroides] pectinophilus ATCC 43243]|uniref:ABC transmembrane type-1 domain-containing protein n=1 Tax=[Bacteroides] pectinophilus ATCC 43243 TaxID=483218 RepID=B7ARZ8_9FIRM|nr:ABC transporter, permease protein [[Bacteroides] pectinophilus ATCC 43243]